MKIPKILFYFLLIIITIGAGACDENESGTLSINRIKKHSSYLNLSFTNTKWKLIGFVNAKNNTIKMAQPENDDSYVLTFYPDSTFQGKTSTNQITGEYVMNSKTGALEIVQFYGTEICELQDGQDYVDALLLIDSFAIKERGLELYYDNKKYYLLFKPIELTLINNHEKLLSSKRKSQV
jgi:hypothetical protein